MNRHRALAYCLSMISAQTLRVCREGKPVPTFPDHALALLRLISLASNNLASNIPGYWLYSGGAATVHLMGTRKSREGIVVRGTEKKYEDTGRLDHIAFAASDVDGVRKRLHSRNVKFRESIVPRTGDTQFFLYDPDGVGVELNFPKA